MTKHESIIDSKESDPIQELLDRPRQRDKIYPELVCFILLHLASISVGVGAWFQL